MRPIRLLTIGHSYVVALNRRLPHEIVRCGQGRWEVTVVAPRFMQADLRPIHLESFPEEACRLEGVAAYATRYPHFMLYSRRLKQLLAEPWDLVYCWEEPYVLAAAEVARWHRSTPLVYYTFQNLSKRYPPPFSWVERYCLRHAAGWVAAGQTVREVLVQRPIYALIPHAVIPLGVDTAVFQPDPAAAATVRAEWGWPESGPPVIGYLGRFVPEKGIRLLMEVLNQLKGAWRAVWIGSGPLERELRAWAGRWPDRVRVVTGVPHREVPRYLNGIDILAAPSQTTRRWREQLGRMLLEGMACGKPVVASDSGEIPHVVADAGIVLPEADVALWVTTLQELLGDPARRAALGQHGRERVEQVFDWRVVAAQYLEFFQTLI